MSVLTFTHHGNHDCSLPKVSLCSHQEKGKREMGPYLLSVVEMSKALSQPG